MRRNLRNRPMEVREEIPIILIVCEGEKTEPNYFRQFHVPGRTVKAVGTGYNTVSLVREALRLREAGTFDQVWCVFDKDDFSAHHFREAIRLATENGLRVAYSNQSFELWYLLHFGYCDSDLHRTGFIEKLGKEIGRPYRKNDRAIFALLEPKMQTAIGHARRLHTSYESHVPEKDSPCTLVYLLVEELCRHAR